MTKFGQGRMNNRNRAPTAPADPELQWVDDDVLNLLDHDSIMIERIHNLGTINQFIGPEF